MPLLVSSVLLFYAGVVFAYFAVFPVMFSYLVGTSPDGVSYMPDMASYLDFVLTMFFAFGVAFEVPVAVVLLVLTGIVQRGETLREPRLRDHRHLRGGGHPHAARRDFTMHHGHSDVPALRGRLVMARVMQKMRREAAAAARKGRSRGELIRRPGAARAHREYSQPGYS